MLELAMLELVILKLPLLELLYSIRAGIVTSNVTAGTQ
jgi:hypothetical protein